MRHLTYLLSLCRVLLRSWAYMGRERFDLDLLRIATKWRVCLLAGVDCAYGAELVFYVVGLLGVLAIHERD
jgi:hypothetical protein